MLFQKANEQFMLAKQRIEEFETELQRVHQLLHEKQAVENTLKEENMTYASESDDLKNKLKHFEKVLNESQQELLERDLQVERERHLHQTVTENYNKLEFSLKNTQAENAQLRNGTMQGERQIAQLLSDKERTLTELAEVKRLVSELEMSKSSLMHDLDQSFAERDCLADQASSITFLKNVSYMHSEYLFIMFLKYLYQISLIIMHAFDIV